MSKSYKDSRKWSENRNDDFTKIKRNRKEKRANNHIIDYQVHNEDCICKDCEYKRIQSTPDQFEIEDNLAEEFYYDYDAEFLKELEKE